MRLLVVVGFLGGYTTFSSFAAETLVLWERGERAMGLGYVAGSVGAGLAAVVLGTAMGRGLIEASARWSARDGRAPSVATPGPGSEEGPAPDRAGGSGAPP
jgi:CrcB protein